MIELRWIIEIDRDSMGSRQSHLEEKVLQYREASNALEANNELQRPIWDVWIDVPTEYFEKD